MFLQIIILSIATFSSYASDSLNNVTADKPYTAQQHFEDIKALLNMLKMDGPDNATNQKVDRMCSFLGQKLTTQNNKAFLKQAFVFVDEMIHQRRYVIIPKEKMVDFHTGESKIKKQRSEALIRLSEAKLKILEAESKDLERKASFFRKIANRCREHNKQLGPL